MDIKEKLQKLFDKEILFIGLSDDNKYYYVTLDDGYFVKPIYRIDLENKKIARGTITVPQLIRLKCIYSKKD